MNFFSISARVSRPDLLRSGLRSVGQLIRRGYSTTIACNEEALVSLPLRIARDFLEARQRFTFDRSFAS